MTRKQMLKEPDEFISTADKIIHWVRQNSKSVIAASCAVIGLVVLISAYAWFQQRKADEAENLLGQALAKYQSVMENKDAPAALEAARSDFDTLLATYGKFPAGKLGTVIYGHVCLAGQAYDDAIAEYQKALTYYGPDSSLHNVILNGLGTAYQQKGDYPRAVTFFKQLAEGASPVLKDVALFNLGRLYNQMGQTEESQKVYQQLSTDFPQSMYATVAKEKINNS